MSTVPFVHLRCPRHRRMTPLPGVLLTVGRPSWRHCPDCKTVWASGRGPQAARERYEAEGFTLPERREKPPPV